MSTLTITRFASVGTVVGGRATITGGNPTSNGWYASPDIFTPDNFGSNDSDLEVGPFFVNQIDNYGILGVLVSVGAFTVSIILSFDQNTAIFSIDGAAPISFNSLPGGFTIDSLNLEILGEVTNNVAPITTVKIDGVHAVNSPSVAPGDVVYTHSYGAISNLLDFINSQLFIQAEGDASASNVFSAFWCSLTGTCSFVSFSWTLDTDTPVKPGDPITISADSELEHVIEIQLTYTDADGEHTISITNFDFQSPTLLIFTLGYWFGFYFGPVTISIIVLNAVRADGTQFSGSVALGTLEILFENGSGIYQIVKNKTSDTFYNREVNNLNNSSLGLNQLRILNEDLNEDEVISIINVVGTTNPIMLHSDFGKLEIFREEYNENDNIQMLFPTISSGPTSEFKIFNPFAKTAYVGG